MRVKPILNSLLVAMTLAGCSSQSSNVTSFAFEGASSYQLNAADVYRLSKEIKSRKLLKSLRPLYEERYFSVEEFQQAIANQLGEDYSDEIYTSLLASSQNAAPKLKLDFLSGNTLKVHFGDIEVPKQQQLLALNKLEVPNVERLSSHSFKTQELQINIGENDLCVEVSDSKQIPLNRICPTDQAGFSLTTPLAYNYNGLGQEFQQPGNSDGRWNNRTRHVFNKMEGFNDGATGNTHIPILYAQSSQQQDFAIYWNNLYASDWIFEDQELLVKAPQGASELIVMTAEKQKELREQFMQLAGTPLVPPRKMFGMWLSEYGFDNWTEMDDKLETLAKNQFPIDGVVMDLQWFGNVSGNDPLSQMGTLTWDRKNFPDPEGKIAQLRQQGIGMMLIEESYISQGLEEFKTLEEKGMLAKDPETGKGINVNASGGGNWWGKGGMMDWSNPEANTFWHDWKRQPLIDMGIMGHWTDLGEPEMYNGKGVYFNDKPHAEVHNLFNYYWLEGIHDGYQRNNVAARPFMMSRSATTGVQKFGASMWSADIGSNLTSLAVHYGQQTNMMLSGIDYYGSDIGGFHRKGLRAIGAEKEKRLKETYTQWFAYSSLFDVPVRPHTENLCNCKETAPDRVGDMVSNRANLELRYELIPYLYSLAHIAHREGKPLFPSVNYVFEQDVHTQTTFNQKMLGEQLMSAVVAKLGTDKVDVYLPEGRWFDYRSGRELMLEEDRVMTEALYRDGGEYQLPLYAVDGAIIPVARSHNNTWSSDVPQNIELKVFGLADNEFVLFEDDGSSNAYLAGEVRETSIALASKGNQSTITIDAKGTYQSMPTSRNVRIDWTLPNSVQVDEVTVLNSEAFGWRQVGNKLVIELDQWSGDQHLEIGASMRK